jgi:hypothetical protein
VTFTATAGGKAGSLATTIRGILSGRGTATIDGIVTPNEWAAASTVDLAVSVPGGTTPGKLYVMNDATNLYFAFKFARSAGNEINNLSFEFDNDESGTLNPGDDGLLVTEGAFHDTVVSTVSPCPAGVQCIFFDTAIGGTNDGAGAFVDDGAIRVYELRHPLNSGKTDDFALQPGSRIGMFLELQIIQGGTATTSQQTIYPGSGGRFVPLVIR